MNIVHVHVILERTFDRNIADIDVPNTQGDKHDGWITDSVQKAVTLAQEYSKSQNNASCRPFVDRKKYGGCWQANAALANETSGESSVIFECK